MTLSQALVRWFRASHRDLPWRRTRDPYAIWVSEIMLQQTRVDVVIPYYERFLARFPTVHALADAPLDDVLHAWSGLGYYRRARQLHAASEAVVRDHAGTLPREDNALRALPGIGRYTAGAIRSIAFGAKAPVVDGNVTRVLSRVFAIDGDAKRLWQLAGELVPASDPSGFNQGLMELGATVCMPRAPRCDVCPFAMFCKAHAECREEAYPPPKKRKATVRTALTAWVIRNAKGEILMRRRDKSEQNAGFWEPPLEQPGIELTNERSAGFFRHQILHRAYTVEVRVATARRAPKGLAWIGKATNETPWTTVARKALALASKR